jgi:GLPGLI family protein
VFNDLKGGSTIVQKKVFEDTYLIKAPTRPIKWKITDETREIAGYLCRRANGLVMDSIYVVAFYSEKILPASGPESFSGLPGMILGLAVPEKNITWFATMVTARPIPDNALAAPVKGKEITTSELMRTLEATFKDWETVTPAVLQGFLL